MKEEAELNTVKEIPAMTAKSVHRYLKEIGQNWTGGGVAMELGCWLGASSVPLLKGLVKAGYNKTFWAFDRWIANKQQVGLAQEEGVTIKLGDDLSPLYLDNVRAVYHSVKAISGMVPKTLERYSKQPIEICIFDAPKVDPVFVETIRVLYPYWISGVTILGLLDYKFYERFQGSQREKLLAPARFIDRNRGCFELIKEWNGESSVFFRYINPLKNI